MEKDSKKEIVAVVGLILIFVLIIGVTYAAFNYAGKGSKENTITTGTVGLMYPSDRGFTYAKGVNDTCYNQLSYKYGVCDQTKAQSSWMFPSSHTSWNEWTLTPLSDYTDRVFFVYYGGSVLNYDASNNGVYDTNTEIRPVVYLKSNVKISGGTGQKTDPYTLYQ